ncbi:unnamed protein product [Closterium sp. Naga37s-1]|nr:unnamed protein product [Closterium sp. Naga37s-1]
MEGRKAQEGFPYSEVFERARRERREAQAARERGAEEEEEEKGGSGIGSERESERGSERVCDRGSDISEDASGSSARASFGRESEASERVGLAAVRETERIGAAPKAVVGVAATRKALLSCESSGEAARLQQRMVREMAAGRLVGGGGKGGGRGGGSGGGRVDSDEQGREARFGPNPSEPLQEARERLGNGRAEDGREKGGGQEGEEQGEGEDEEERRDEEKGKDVGSHVGVPTGMHRDVAEEQPQVLQGCTGAASEEPISNAARPISMYLGIIPMAHVLRPALRAAVNHMPHCSHPKCMES